MEKIINRINEEKIRSYTTAIFAVLLLVVLPLVPEIKFNKNIYEANILATLKTSIFHIITLLSLLSFTFVKYVEISKNKYKVEKLKLSIYDILIFIYLGLVIISTICSKYKFSNMFWGVTARGEGLATIFCYIVTFIIFEKNFKYNKKIFAVMTMSLVILSIWGIIQTIIPESINLSFINKGLIMQKYAIGNMVNPNFFSSFLLIFLPIYIIKFLDTLKFRHLLVSTILFVAFICAKTLSGYLTFAVVCLGILIIMGIYLKDIKKLLKGTIALVISFTLSFILITIINGDGYVKEIEGTKTNIEEMKQGSTSFGSSRGLAWKIAIQVIKNYPIFGVGLESFGLETVANEEYFWSEYSYLGTYYDKAHCEYLHMAAVTGIPSALVYISFLTILGINLIKKYIEIIKTKKRDKESILLIMVAASIFSYIFQAGANISITCVAPAFWVMVGIGANLCIKKETKLLTNKKSVL